MKTSLLPLLTVVKKISEQCVCAIFKGNPKTYVVSCYSPTNSSPESEITEFYEALGQTVQAVLLHPMLMIGGDFNAQVSQGFSYHDNNNRNGQYLIDFTEEFNILIGNTSFQKAKNKLWTWRSPKK